jgi:tetratricopeptide (TPR) repeat protein
MEKWINDWQTRYGHLKALLENSGDWNEKLYEELASECGVLLETWIELEDDLADLIELKKDKQEKSSFDVTHLDGPTYFHLEIFDKAIQTLKKELSIEQKNELALYLYLGFSYLYEGEIDEGKETFLYVIHTSVNRLEKHFAYVGLGCLNGRIHRYEEAMNFFEKANLLYNNSDVPYNIGMAFVMLKQYELAIPYLEKVIQANAEDGEASYFLGSCYLKIGNETKAFEAWYVALQKLEYKDLLVTIAYQFEVNGYYTAAIHCYKRLEALGYLEVWVDHGIAWNYGLLEMKEKASSMFAELLLANPEDTNIWISFIWLLSKWQETEALLHWLEKAKENKIKHPLIKQVIDQWT